MRNTYQGHPEAWKRWHDTVQIRFFACRKAENRDLPICKRPYNPRPALVWDAQERGETRPVLQQLGRAVQHIDTYLRRKSSQC